MQAFDLFVAILLGGVGYSNSLFLVLAQTYASAFLVLRTMFTAMRNRPIIIKIMAVMIPMVLGGTYLIAASIVFGAFFSSAWTSRDLILLVAQTLTNDFIYELLAWIGIFVLFTVIYSLLYRLRLWEWLLTFGLEIIAAVVLLVLYGGLLINGFPYTIIDLCQSNVFLVKLPIYGVFMIVFKDFVLLCSLFIGLLLREPKPQTDKPEDYPNPEMFYEKRVQKYLTKNYMALGVSLFLFGLCTTALFGWIFWDEYHSEPFPPQLSSDETMGVVFLIIITLVTIGYALVGLLMIGRRFFPHTARIYRKLLSLQSNSLTQDQLLRLFYQEVVLAYPTGSNEQQSIFSRKNIITTEHFSMETTGLKTVIKWREPRTDASASASSYRSHRGR